MTWRGVGWQIGLAALLVTASCSTSAEPAVPTPISVVDLVPIDGFGQTTLTIDGGGEWPVMLADTPELRARGLMGVTDLGPWAGMVFLYEQPTDDGFWMKHTLMPLSIFWADDEGVIVGSAEMVPCPLEDDACPSWRPGATYTVALEIPAGTADLLGISASSILRISGGP